MKLQFYIISGHCDAHIQIFLCDGEAEIVLHREKGDMGAVRLCIKRSSDDEYEKLFERMKQIRRGNRGPDVKNARLKEEEEEEVTSDVYTGGYNHLLFYSFHIGAPKG